MMEKQMEATTYGLGLGFRAQVHSFFDSCLVLLRFRTLAVLPKP